jgi:hypothetical protein
MMSNWVNYRCYLWFGKLLVTTILMVRVREYLFEIMGLFGS